MFRKIFYSAALGILLFSVSSFTPQTSWACEGTFRPPCGQTAWLAKFVSSSIVLPGSGANITVPIGVVPYVLWSHKARQLAAVRRFSSARYLFRWAHRYYPAHKLF